MHKSKHFELEFNISTASKCNDYQYRFSDAVKKSIVFEYLIIKLVFKLSVDKNIFA